MASLVRFRSPPLSMCSGGCAKWLASLPHLASHRSIRIRIRGLSIGSSWHINRRGNVHVFDCSPHHLSHMILIERHLTFIPPHYRHGRHFERASSCIILSFFGIALFFSIGYSRIEGGLGSLLIAFLMYSVFLGAVNKSVAKMSIVVPVSGGWIRMGSNK